MKNLRIYAKNGLWKRLTIGSRLVDPENMGNGKYFAVWKFVTNTRIEIRVPQAPACHFKVTVVFATYGQLSDYLVPA